MTSQIGTSRALGGKGQLSAGGWSSQAHRLLVFIQRYLAAAIGLMAIGLEPRRVKNGVYESREPPPKISLEGPRHSAQSAAH